MINGYKIIRTIGKGGTSVIKLVEDKHGKQFAMKIFEPLNEVEQQKIFDETEKEVEFVQKVNLPEIPKYYNFVKSATWIRSDGRR